MRDPLIRRTITALLARLGPLLPFETSITVARQLLFQQGFGAGESIASSGELAVLELLAGSDHPTLFDVGGHVGEYTEVFIRRFPNGRSFVFEPSVAHLGLLRKRLQNESNVKIFETALGAAIGEATLYKDAEITGLASLIARRLDHYGIKMDREERVKLSTIDDVRSAERVAFIDLLKIDVEGIELEVLKGAKQAFAQRAIGIVQFEFGGCNLDSRTNLQDFFQFFSEHGFQLHIVQPSGKIHLLPRYDEIYEQFRTTNYVALSARRG
jgi:FkbM family methyltransferase